jgi:phage-related holin
VLTNSAHRLQWVLKASRKEIVQVAKISRQGRLWLRAFHLFFMVLWIGVAASEALILSFTGNATDVSELSAYFTTIQQLDSVLVPAAIGTVITGVLLVWLSPSVFFKYKWVIYKEVAVILCLLIALIWLDPGVANLTAFAKAEGLSALQNPEYVSTWNTLTKLGIVLPLLLISAVFVSVLKPWRKHAGAEAAT